MSLASDGEQGSFSVITINDDPEVLPVTSETAEKPTENTTENITTTVDLIPDSQPKTAKASSSSVSVAYKPKQYDCENNPDLFCYICGFSCFGNRRKSIKNSELCQQAYQLYFGRPITNIDEPWTPNYFCTSCYNKLYNWYKDLPNGSAGLDWCEPMVWGPPNEDHSNCYFCAVPKKYISSGHKHRKDLILPIINLCVLLPRRNYDGFVVPECPKNCGTSISLKANQKDVDIDHHYSHHYSEDPSLEVPIPTEPQMVPVPEIPKPEPFTKEGLKELLADLQPLTTEQQELLVASLFVRNLVIKEVRSTRAQAAGKRVSYAFAMSSPIHKKKLPANAFDWTKKKKQPEMEDTSVDYDSAPDAGFDMSSQESASDESSEEEVEVDDDDRDDDYSPNENELKADEVDVEREEKFKTIILSVSCNVEGCDAVLPDKSKLFAHLLSVHNRYRYTCEVPGCGHTVRTNRRLEAHISAVHLKKRKKLSAEEAGEVFKCVKCSTTKKFLNYNGLKRHNVEYHNKGSYKCGWPECEFTLPAGSEMCVMSKHVREDHKKKRYQCTWGSCTSGFIGKAALTIHMKVVHSGEMPFKCEEEDCDRRFVNQKALNSHIMRAHSNGELPFACDICGKRFVDKYTLGKHGKAHGDPQYTCSFCDKQFIWSSSYKKHVAKHTGEKICYCPNCGKGFYWGGNLRKHLRNKVCTTEKGRRRSYRRGDLPCSSAISPFESSGTPAAKAPRKRTSIKKQSQEIMQPQQPMPIQHRLHQPHLQQAQLQQSTSHQAQQHHLHSSNHSLQQLHQQQQQLLYIQSQHQLQRTPQMVMLEPQTLIYSANQTASTSATATAPMYQFERQQDHQPQSIEELFGSDWHLN